MSRKLIAAVGLGILGTIPLYAQDNHTAFTNVSVIPMDSERVLADQSVVVRDGRIVAMGPAEHFEIPRGAIRIDGRGRYLMPGLADMHLHAPGIRRTMAHNIYVRTDSVAYSDADMAEVERILRLNLANGVTTVRIMYGNSKIVALRERIARGELLGPRVSVSSPSVFPAYTPAGAAALVEQAQRDGYDFIKLYNGDEAWDTAVAVARRVGIPVAGHAPRMAGNFDARSVPAAIQAGYRSIEHLAGVAQYLGYDRNEPAGVPDSAALHALAASFRGARLWNCPTIASPSISDDEWQLVSRYLADSLRLDIDRQRRQRDSADSSVSTSDFQERRPSPFVAAVVKGLHNAGAGLLLGTDAFGDRVPGFAVYRELVAFVDAGLTPYEALTAGTRNVAEFLGISDSAGTVAIGMRADLVLLDGNPLESLRTIRRPAGVMIGGRWLDRRELDAVLQAIEGTLDG